MPRLGISELGKCTPASWTTRARPTTPSNHRMKTMVDDSHIYLGIEKWPADGTVTLRRFCGTSDTSTSVKLDPADTPLTGRGQQRVITARAARRSSSPSSRSPRRALPSMCPPADHTISEQTTTIPPPASKVQGPTPRPAETSFTASSPPVTRSPQACASFDTEGFTDDYAKYKAPWAIRRVKGLTVTDTQGVGPSPSASTPRRASPTATTTRRTRSGLGKDATVASVTVKSEKLTPTITVAPRPSGWQDRQLTGGLRPLPSGESLTLLRPRRGRHGRTDDGSFTAEVTVPAPLQAGDHTVVAAAESQASAHS